MLPGELGKLFACSLPRALWACMRAAAEHSGLPWMGDDTYPEQDKQLNIGQILDSVPADQAKRRGVGWDCGLSGDRGRFWSWVCQKEWLPLSRIFVVDVEDVEEGVS
jgi:hypothetical protein